ncbi:hypothetical protein AVEN_233555-1 [Araneus ventricosus]|uniref:Uncharacterized protein n=1 Tax=Araneus ventricosus TaxID=182803 RepID=A0A4Y2LMQ1_ARAVE|nr:hypothetical protein AVEN_233555-1 [Araneus ventricosus]
MPVLCSWSRLGYWPPSPSPFLSMPFTSLPKWNFWDTGRKKQSSVLKTDRNWHSGMAMLEFKRTQNQHISCADSNLGTRLEGSGTRKNLPTLRPRVEVRNEARNLPRRGRGGYVDRILRL